jgi:chromosome segregation ATPase
MTRDEHAHLLHDRATRGEVLSSEEQLRLEHWYAEQDRAEQAVLDANQTTTRATLQQQVDAALAQLHSVVQQIEDLSHQNDALRRNIAAAQRQLAQRQPLRAA